MSITREVQRDDFRSYNLSAKLGVCLCSLIQTPIEGQALSTQEWQDVIFTHKKLRVFGKTNTKADIQHKTSASSTKGKTYFKGKLVFGPTGSRDW